MEILFKNFENYCYVIRYTIHNVISLSKRIFFQELFTSLEILIIEFFPYKT